MKYERCPNCGRKLKPGDDFVEKCLSCGGYMCGDCGYTGKTVGEETWIHYDWERDLGCPHCKLSHFGAKGLFKRIQ